MEKPLVFSSVLPTPDAVIRRMIAGRVLPWHRFWTPSGNSISAGHDGRGFLDDPEGDFGRLQNPDVRALSDLLSKPCLVLSGQPGIGKTTEVEALCARSQEWLAPDERLIFLPGRILTSEQALRRETVESPKWRSAIAAGGRVRLLIDGVDEALRRISVLVPALAHWLKDEPRDQIRVILACRSAEWHLSDGQTLAGIWGEEAGSLVFELCPLRWKDAELAARASGVDPEAFYNELVRHQVKGLAARPITLRLLLEEMRVAGTLPSSHHELFSGAILRLCEEVDAERVRHLPSPRPEAARIARLAARIAALTMLGGRNVIVRSGSDAREGELPMDAIATGFEAVTGQRFPVTRDLVAVALDTPLFSFRGPERYGFDHQTFAEHLAADYLQSCTPTQLRRLLCVSFEGHERVAPQLADVAARVATANAAWCDYLITTEPELLLRADASPLSVKQRERAVASLLSRAGREEAFDEAGTGYFYHTLRHPKLAEQLRPYIENPRLNPVVRRMAFNIAGDAQVLELEQLLWERIEARDPAFGLVCAALNDIAGTGSRKKLLAGLRGELPDDDGGNLKELALRKLVPAELPVREVLPFLAPPTREHIYFGQGISRHLVVEDLPAVLEAMAEGRLVGRDFIGLNELAARAFEMAMENIARPKISSSLARYWRACARESYALPSRVLSSDPDPLAALQDSSKRRVLARMVLTLPDADAYDLDCGMSCLITNEDVEWLLEELAEIPVEARAIWAKVCARQLRQELPDSTRDLLRRRYVEFSELRALLPEPGPHDIATALQRRRRAKEIRMERNRKRNALRYRRRSRTERLEAVWRELDTNEMVWVAFCSCAFQPEEGDPKLKDHSDHGDITTSPAWILADEPRKVGLRGAARRFLLRRSDRGRKRGTWTNWADAACFAIGLLREVFESDQELQEAVRTRWPRVIFDDFDRNSIAQRSAVAAVYRLVPDVAATSLTEKLRESNRRDGSCSSLSRFTDCWDNRHFEVVRQFLFSRGLKAGSIRRAFKFLCEQDRPSAVALFDEMLSRFGGFPPLDQRGRALLSVGLFLLYAERWTIAWGALEKCPKSIARQVFLEAAHDYLYHGLKVDDRLGTAELTALCAKVWQIFPRKEYGERHDAQGCVNSRHMMPDLRDGLTAALVERATLDACVGLRRLASVVDPEERIWMRWRHHEAVRNALRRIWTARTRTSGELLAMMRDFRVLTVDTVDDLLDAVLASLERLQQRLGTVESPELRALWNEPGHGQAPSPKEEAVLSDMIADWLRRDLGPHSGVVLNREVQATMLSRLDIKVEAVPLHYSSPPLTLVVEVKGDWNRDVTKSLGAQLAKRYLLGNGWTHGIYIVGWFGGRPAVPQAKKRAQWPPISFAEAGTIAAEWQETQCPPGLTIRACLLNCLLPTR